MLVHSVSYFLIIVLLIVEVHSKICVEPVVEHVGEVNKPICKSNCTNGYCKDPEGCACNAGYTKRDDTCVPVCEGDCLHGTCIAPNTCRCDSGYNIVNDTCVKEHISRSNNEDTTTTTKDPFKTMRTDNYYYNHTENTTMSETTAVPYFVSSSSSTETVVGNDANTTVASGDPVEKSWMQQHGMFIWIPIIVIVTSGLILLLVWRRTPMIIINFFKGRSYNVQAAFQKEMGPIRLIKLKFKSDEMSEREAQS